MSTLAIFGCLFVALLLIAVLAVTASRGSMVSVEFKECSIDCSVAEAIASGESIAALKQKMAEMFRVVPCPVCGSKAISGAGVIVFYCRDQEAVDKPEDCRDNSACFRICGIVLESSSRPTLGFMGFERQPGMLACSSPGCAWTVRGPEGDSGKEVSIVGMFDPKGDK